jgi:CDP-2,3-bis-(O-geranylgeranyl)-sn-glycerol synthase
METILFALWFFLPAGFANASPVIAKYLPYLSKVATPLDFHARYRGKRVFGPHKTWRGLVVGICTATLVVFIQQLIFQRYEGALLDIGAATEVYNYLNYPALLSGFLFGFGALAGDAVESFIKRQRNIDSGGVWFPYDQIDYIIGGCLAISLLVRLEPAQYAAIFTVWFLLHLLFSYIGYLLRLKSQPI